MQVSFRTGTSNSDLRFCKIFPLYTVLGSFTQRSVEDKFYCKWYPDLYSSVDCNVILCVIVMLISVKGGWSLQNSSLSCKLYFLTLTGEARINLLTFIVIHLVVPKRIVLTIGRKKNARPRVFNLNLHILRREGSEKKRSHMNSFWPHIAEPPRFVCNINKQNMTLPFNCKKKKDSGFQQPCGQE